MEEELNKIEVEKWLCNELHYKSKIIIKDIIEGGLTARFTSPSGKELVIPGFWAGGENWTVRYALNEIGEWKYEVINDLDEMCIYDKGYIECKEYSGNLEVYKHGFVTTKYGQKFFTYDDGKPFFYLGDTHWTLFEEAHDENSKNLLKTVDQPYRLDNRYRFQYMLKRRVEEGYTVYQSQSIQWNLKEKWNPEDGVNESIIKRLNQIDFYFKALADAGIVHANAQWVFPNKMINKLRDPEYAECMARHWVARYGAYPVMWTMGQTVDRQGYKHYNFDETNNPYHHFCKCMIKYDAYRHPTTAHQENALFTGVKGEVTDKNDILGRHPSSFDNIIGHDWFAVQWKPEVIGEYNINIPKDYYKNSKKPAVNYEGYYNMLGGKDNACRIQAWMSMFSGFCGYGYGTQGTWCIGSQYMINQPTFDGLEVVTPEDKHKSWPDVFDLPAANQVALMKIFFSKFNWWDLKPDFEEHFLVRDENDFAMAASIGDSLVLTYIYSLHRQVKSKLVNLSNDPYHLTWFNPINGQIIDGGFVQVINGEHKIKAKPYDIDMVMILTKQTGGSLVL